MPDTPVVAEVPAVPTKVRTKHPVSPEVAALMRAADADFAATVRTARAVIDTANAMVEQAKDRCTTTMAALLCSLGVAGSIVATEGLGADTVLVIEAEVPTNG